MEQPSLECSLEVLRWSSCVSCGQGNPPKASQAHEGELSTQWSQGGLTHQGRVGGKDNVQLHNPQHSSSTHPDEWEAEKE